MLIQADHLTSYSKITVVLTPRASSVPHEHCRVTAPTSMNRHCLLGKAAKCTTAAVEVPITQMLVQIKRYALPILTFTGDMFARKPCKSENKTPEMTPASTSWKITAYVNSALHTVHSSAVKPQETMLPLPHSRNTCSNVTVSNIGIAATCGRGDFVQSASNSHATEPRYPPMRYTGDTTSRKWSGSVITHDSA